MGYDIEGDDCSEDGLNVVTVQTEACELRVYTQGGLSARRSSCVILTLHDLGTNHRSLARFCALASMRVVTERSLVIHVCVPGQETGASDTHTVPSLQALSTSVLCVMEQLQLEQVIIMGVGAGANTAARLALAAPNKVLGMIFVQPMLANSGIMDTARLRSVAGDLRSGHSRDSDHFLLQHCLGQFSDQPSQQTLNMVKTFKTELHDDINPRNLQLYLESFMMRSDLMDKIKKLKCDVLILAGVHAANVKHSDNIHQALIGRKSFKANYIKVSGVGHVLLEAPEKTAEAILLFCQGLGMVPAVLGGGRRRGVSRGVSMSEADVPNISRLSLSE